MKLWNVFVMSLHRGFFDHRQQIVDTQDGPFARCECSPSKFRRIL